MYDTVIVGVEPSHEDVAAKVLQIGAKLVEAKGKLIAFHVLPEVPVYVDTYVPPRVQDEAMAEAHKELTALVNDLGITAEVRIVSGVPHTRILEAIDEAKPDLVILGSHRPGLADYFLGSTAARVVRHAQCSVLVDR